MIFDKFIQLNSYRFLFWSFLGKFFRRFGSKRKGAYPAADPYISAIMEMAKSFFQRRVHFWNDDPFATSVGPMYTLEEIQKAEEELQRF